ncbi:MAG: alpha/beta hydrolase [Akkermansiaceae bacterium]|jgi:enterochelin esterase-like enzyme|nr:esterase family protein [Luteolibacter sp.]
MLKLILTCLLVIAGAVCAQESSPKLTLPEQPEPKLGPDSLEKPDVPKGKVTNFIFKDSKVFAGTSRQIHLYIPANHDATQPTAVMVFQDGHAYVNPKGDYRVPTVFDNLIAAKQMPPVIGIFIDPGHKGEAPPESAWKKNNRSFEYDTLSADYATFLIDEILPLVEKQYKLTSDPEMRAICGASSGGICAWTVAWQRPDQFRKVVSSIGSFTNIRGGDAYPGMIRKTEKKPIRAFFEEGIDDLDNEHGNWPLGNMQMEAALKFKGYDYKYVWGKHGHNGKHMGAIFPDAMRWLWRK